jgi:hypothetical protein
MERLHHASVLGIWLFVACKPPRKRTPYISNMVSAERQSHMALAYLKLACLEIRPPETRQKIIRATEAYLLRWVTDQKTARNWGAVSFYAASAHFRLIQYFKRCA